MDVIAYYLSKFALVFIMLAGASHAMEPGFGWYQFWGGIMFIAALTIWSAMEFYDGYKYRENEDKCSD